MIAFLNLGGSVWPHRLLWGACCGWTLLNWISTLENCVNAVKLRLHGQPIQLLAILLQAAGNLVTREELRSQLWTADTFVDFDHGLHNAIARLREVLGDSADTPRYIETLPRRGYRFIAPVEEVENHAPERPAPIKPASEAPVLVKRSNTGAALALALLAIVGIGAVLWLARTISHRTSAAFAPTLHRGADTR